MMFKQLVQEIIGGGTEYPPPPKNYISDALFVAAMLMIHVVRNVKPCRLINIYLRFRVKVGPGRFWKHR